MQLYALSLSSVWNNEGQSLAILGVDKSRGMMNLYGKRGIFQSDSLESILVLLSSGSSKHTSGEFWSRLPFERGGQVISNFLYMDDLKRFAPNKLHLIKLLKVTKTFSNTIRMEFGVSEPRLQVNRCTVWQVGLTWVPKMVVGPQSTHMYKYRTINKSKNQTIKNVAYYQLWRDPAVTK